MTIIPTPEQIRIAELNGWDPQHVAENHARNARIHDLMRKSKAELLAMARAVGTTGLHDPATWTKQELAASLASRP
jgi:hypothetical protein